MKYLKLLLISVLITSCTNVQFVEPQPKNLKTLEEIPNKFQGTFMYVEGEDTAMYIVDSFSITENGLVRIIDSTSSMVIKSQGNTLYLNRLGSNGYECTRITVVSSFNYEKIEASSINIFYPEHELKGILYEVINTPSDGGEKKEIFLIKDVNYNQLERLFNETRIYDELIRIK